MAVAKTLRAILVGNPPDPSKEVVNAELLAKLEEMEAQALLNGGLYFEDTLANLNAVTGMATGDTGFVLADGTAANNGVYLYSGSWVKTSDLPAVFETIGIVAADITDSSTVGRAVVVAATAAIARTALGLGALAQLDEISDLTLITGSSAFGRTLMALANAAAGRTALGLGSAAELGAGVVTLQGGSRTENKTNAREAASGANVLIGREGDKAVIRGRSYTPPVGSAYETDLFNDTGVDLDGAATVDPWGILFAGEGDFANFSDFGRSLGEAANLAAVLALLGIEAGATADQSGAEIKTAYEAEADTNAFTDAEKTKLTGVETGATGDQNGAEIKALYEAEANTNAYTDAEKAKLDGIDPSATANATNAALRDRTTHTGEQAISTVTGLQTALDSKGPATLIEVVSASASGSAYTATAPANFLASDGAEFLFTPDVTNTVGSPTLKVGTDSPRAINKTAPGTTLGVGVLIGGSPVRLRRSGTIYVLVQDAKLRDDLAQEVADRAAADADLTARAAARAVFADQAAFLAGTSDGEYGYFGGALYRNDAGVSASISADELLALRQRISSFAVATTTSNSATAYTATTVLDGVMADDDGDAIVFTPNLSNTGGSPTLSVNGGPAFPIGESGADALGIGRLEAGYPVLLYRTGGAWRLLTDKWLKNEIAKQADIRDSIAQHAAYRSVQDTLQNNALTEAGKEMFPRLRTGASGERNWVASAADHDGMIAVSNNQAIDLRFMIAGAARPITIQTYSNSSAVLITPTGNHTVNASSIVEVYRTVLDEFVLRAVAGSFTADTGTTPVATRSFITAGQSLAARFLAGSSMAGLQKGWVDFNGDATASWWPIQGAVGGSGLVPASNATNYWWNPVTDAPGPNLIAWEAALNDAINTGQPDPAFILWIFGQTDAGSIGTDPTLTEAAYKATLRKVFYYMQDAINPGLHDTPIIACPLGSFDQDYDANASAVRSIERQLAAEETNVFLGPEYGTLQTPRDDVHLTPGAQEVLGYRVAAVADNILNAAGHETGPSVTAVTEVDGGKIYRLTVTPQTGFEFTRPRECDGFAIYGAGATPLTGNPIPIQSTTWADAGSGVWTLDLELQSPVSGCSVVFPAGAMTWQDKGNFVRNERNDPIAKGYGNFWPLVGFELAAT